MRIDCCVSYFQKQLIGLLPNGTECLFYYAPDVNVDSYNVDGILFDDPASINAALNPYGIYYCFIYAAPLIEPRFIITYVGTEPPTYLPAITDNNGDPVTWGWTTCCTKVCLEMTINENDYSFFQNGFGYICYSPSNFDDQYAMETFLKSLYGQQTTYTAVYNPSDATFFVTIDNAYVCNLPLAWSGDNVTYTDMVPCAPPPAICAYYNQFVDNTSGCFATGSYDFEGCLIDFNCLASFYPNGYYVQDGANLPFDYCSHLTIISNSTSIPAPINYLDYNGNPQTSDWTALCDYGCVQNSSISFKPTAYITSMSFCGIDIEFFSYGGNLDLNDTVNAELILFGIFKTYFPTCTAVTITDIGGGNLRITVFDIYSNISSGTWLMEDFLGFTYILGLQAC